MPTRQARGGSSTRTRRAYPRRGLNPNHAADLGSASDRRSPGGNGKFEHIPSISRSSGVDPGGDMLKDHRVQEEYRLFLQQKLDAYWKLYPSLSRFGESDVQKSDAESNILIQFRKLREGVSASRRHDQFAVEAYETSLFLSIIFRSHVQTTSILSHLLPDLYLSIEHPPNGSSSLTVLLASLHSLDIHYPSQRAFLELSKNLPPSFTLRRDHEVWLRELSSSLRRGGYAQFGRLTQSSSLTSLAAWPASETPDQRTPPVHQDPDLRLLSFQTLVNSLRTHLRLSAWRMLRSAYREFALPLSDTTAWLSGVLLLERETERQEDLRGGDRVQLWFALRENLGEVGRKGDNGRWAITTKK
ncbi:hypothetical protein EDB85DRAFT_1857124 [Lactarius pseudohatsudake]|nr:hypothetical protein EDB85DRAFT_1857124 [Lactarius pseudohatsudake]